MSWRKFLVIPQLAWYGMRTPRGSQVEAWDRFWRRIDKTGRDGQVLWDAASRAELDQLQANLRAHADVSLPLVDVGCGNGRQSRELAALAPRVLGIDASQGAIDHARAESSSVANLTFRRADITTGGVGAELHRELGDANVFIRGVFHVLDHKGRLAAVQSLRNLLGTRGTLYLSETNIQSPLDHLEFQGATATTMPEPLRRAVAAGIRPPARFGAAEVRAYFPPDTWSTLTEGPALMHGVPLHAGRALEEIPSYMAILRGRT
jgi:SAM-dependent methyltransferase